MPEAATMPRKKTKTQTVWISKYALTTGIYKVEAEVDADMAMAGVKSGWVTQYFHGHGVDWHWTEAGAKERAEVMRKRKIASLRKQIEKIEKIVF